MWTDDGRTTEASHPISSPGAFGSEELKTVALLTHNGRLKIYVKLRRSWHLSPYLQNGLVHLAAILYGVISGTLVLTDIRMKNKRAMRP